MRNRLALSISSTALWLLTSANAAAAQDSLTDVDSLMRARMSERNVVGAAVAVVERGRVIKSAGYGTADLSTNEPVTTQTAFFVASITKAISGATVLSLVQDGRLRLDDHIAAFLPGLPESWRPVTVRQLLGHTSALPDVEAIPGVYMANLDAALDQLRDLPLRGSPGAAFQYTQTNWALLAKIVEATTQRPFTEYAMQRVVHPLGLHSATFGAYDAIGDGRSRWYTTAVQKTPGELEFGGSPRPLHTDYPPYIWAAAGLYISAEDLARWVDAFARGAVIDSALVDLLWTPVPLENGDASSEGMAGWVALGEGPSRSLLAVGGARAAVMHVPERGLTVALVTNTQGAGERSWIRELVRIYSSQLPI